MPGRRKWGNKRKKKREDDQTLTTRMVDEETRQGAQSPFAVDLILQFIFSHLEEGDLLRARLVAKKWTPLATEEVRGRKSVFPWIGRLCSVEEERKRFKKDIFILDEGSAVGFMKVMTPSLSLIPVQQIALRLDLLSIEPGTLLSLLSFIAPWVHTLRLVPFAPWDMYVRAPLLGVEGRKAMAWSAALHSFPPLDLPRLETLEVGLKDEYSRTLHQSLAMSLVHLVTKVVKGSKGLQCLGYWTRFFGDDGLDVQKEAAKEASKVILQALPSSLKRLDVGSYNEVDYGTLTTLGLNLEEFMEDSKPEPGAFLEFLEGQKTGLKRLSLLYLEDFYDPSNFPKLPLVTELKMIPKHRSSFECLKAFPNLLTLQIHLGWWQTDITDTRGPDELSQLPAHPSVRRLVIHDYLGLAVTMPFPLIKQVLPNLTHVDFTSTHWWNLTLLFTHLPRLRNLKLSLSDIGNLKGLQYLLSGIHPSVFELGKDFDILDTEAFAAVEVIGSRRGDSMVGLGNLKDLQVLDISESSEECREVFLSKPTFGTAFMKMRFLKEIRIGGELPKAFEPVLEALRNKGISVWGV